MGLSFPYGSVFLNRKVLRRNYEGKKGFLNANVEMRNSIDNLLNINIALAFTFIMIFLSQKQFSIIERPPVVLIMSGSLYSRIVRIP